MEEKQHTHYHYYCQQEERITRLEEKSKNNRYDINELKDSIKELTVELQKNNQLLALDKGKDTEQEFIKGYVISFVISIGIIVITHIFRL